MKETIIRMNTLFMKLTDTCSLASQFAFALGQPAQSRPSAKDSKTEHELLAHRERAEVPLAVGEPATLGNTESVPRG